MSFDNNPCKVPIAINDNVYLNVPYQDLAPYTQGVVTRLEYFEQTRSEVATVRVCGNYYSIPTNYLTADKSLITVPLKTSNDDLFE